MDLISREAVLNEVSRWRGYLDDDMIYRIQIGMKRLPSVEPERKTGRWIPQDNNKISWTASTAVYYYPKCSVCGLCAAYTNFCPHCGADMRGEQDDES